MCRPICAIVGVGEGLGKALAIKFANEGFDIAIISRSKVNSMPAIQAASDAKSDVHFIEADANNPKSVEGALNKIMTDMGKIEILIYNCRGEFKACAPLDMTYRELTDIFELEVVGAFAAAKAVLPKMIENSNGSIFFSSATAAFRGSGSYPIYSIGKFGLRALSQSLAKAYSKDGVHIAHFRLDCDLDVPYVRNSIVLNGREKILANPNDIALCYWLTHQQPKGAWSNEIELRPNQEIWTY